MPINNDYFKNESGHFVDRLSFLVHLYAKKNSNNFALSKVLQNSIPFSSPDGIPGGFLGPTANIGAFYDLLYLYKPSTDSLLALLHHLQK